MTSRGEPAGAMGYPAALETYWRARAEAAGDTSRIFQGLENRIARLSDAFTVGRAEGLADDYTAELSARLAYGLFFFPQTFMRMRWALAEARAAAGAPAAPEEPLRVLDLGAGTGASALACAAAYADREVRLTLLDRSAAALAEAADVFAAARAAVCPRATLETRVGDLRAPPGTAGGWHLIAAGFALNEAFDTADDAAVAAWAEDGLARLAPGGWLALVEPATQPAAGRLMALRDRWAAAGRVRILGPCAHRRPCPLREAAGAWCHEVRRWRPPASLERLNRRLFRDVRALKFSFLAVANEPAGAESERPAAARLIAPVHQAAGRFVSRVCAPDGREHPVEWLTRGLTRAEQADLAARERGDFVDLSGARLLGDGRTLRPLARPCGSPVEPLASGFKI